MKNLVTDLISSPYFLEVRRKSLHIIFGATILLSYFGLWKISIQQDFLIRLGLIVIFMMLTNAIFTRKSLYALSKISKKLSERETTSISGIGALMLLLGCYVPIVFGLSNEIVIIVIISLSVGDGFATIIGKYFGKYSYSFSPSRSLLGTLGGFFAALAVSWLLIDPFGWQLVLACLLGSLIELALGLLPPKIDAFVSRYSVDNILIPIGIIGFLLRIA